jgi:glyoxylase-like metal-dependent hydrolase (beta-lactamase superfamily II)
VLPLPFPGLHEVNAYLLADDSGSTLVDCGMLLPDADDGEDGWSQIVEALEACDHTPKDISRLVCTHTHIDHYGLAARLKAESGCEIVIHEAGNEELDVLRNPQRISERLRETYADHGIKGDELDELTSYEDWRRFVTGVVEADTWVTGAETLAVGGRNWELVHTPGHARSHICLFDKEASLLISGDHLLGSITPHIDFHRGLGDPLGDFLESLDKVERLAPEMVLPGHGRPFFDGAERARATLRHHERRLGAIIQVVRRQACSADRITKEIFGRTLLHFEKRLGLGEALAHIHYLRVRGEIERTDAPDGTRLYRKASRRPAREVPE